MTKLERLEHENERLKWALRIAEKWIANCAYGPLTDEDDDWRWELSKQAEGIADKIEDVTMAYAARDDINAGHWTVPKVAETWEEMDLEDRYRIRGEGFEWAVIDILGERHTIGGFVSPEAARAWVVGFYYPKYGSDVNDSVQVSITDRYPHVPF